jgi:cytochrome c553
MRSVRAGAGSRSGLDGAMTEVLHSVSDADLVHLARYLSQLR